MKNYHRKTLINKESWVLIDDWYWCPKPSIDKRVKEEKDRLSGITRHSPMWFSYGTWHRDQYKLEARLAHDCDDGGIRAPSYVEYYKQKGGMISIYGKCRRCEKSLSDGIKGIIIMEQEL